jgi:hypothetical protein
VIPTCGLKNQIPKEERVLEQGTIVAILVPRQRLDIGPAEHGDKMLLKEMFSPIGSPKEDDQDVDWLGDLKFFMDNDNKMLENFVFPAVEKHKEHAGNPNTWKLYVRPIQECLKCYLEQFEVENPDEKFPEEALEELAHRIAEEQEHYIQEGDYD